MNEQSYETLFFYGLFMDGSLLEGKGVHVSGSKVAVLEGYKLRIGRRATLVRDMTARSFGVVGRVARQDVERLYAEESVADYVAEPVSVTLPDGTAEAAVCYNLPAEKLEGTNPEYAQALLQLAGKLDFPDEYLEEIERFAKP
ncbi:MAG: gamma-glutamylcyclotransferase [Acidobacteriota bacterium]|jgi:hypothetical protein